MYIIMYFLTTFRFFNKSLEEERLDRSKYREYSSRFQVLCCFVITVYRSLLKQQDLDTVIIMKVSTLFPAPII